MTVTVSWSEIYNITYPDFSVLLQWLVDESHKAIEAGESVICAWVGPKLIITPVDAEATKVNIRNFKFYQAFV
jgi:hypothetical protein